MATCLAGADHGELPSCWSVGGRPSAGDVENRVLLYIGRMMMMEVIVWPYSLLIESHWYDLVSIIEVVCQLI